MLNTCLHYCNMKKFSSNTIKCGSADNIGTKKKNVNFHIYEYCVAKVRHSKALI